MSECALLCPFLLSGGWNGSHVAGAASTDHGGTTEERDLGHGADAIPAPEGLPLHFYERENKYQLY